MNLYIGQKAQQALEALGSGESLERRLQEAHGHFMAVADAHFLNDARPEVRDAIMAFAKADVGANLKEASTQCRLAIELVFSACGREHAANNQAD